MAKYCAKCGKQLPEGAQACPDCGGTAQHEGAALFTHMSNETEGWKNDRPGKLKRILISRSHRGSLILAAAIAAAAVIVVALIFLLRPSARVLRALKRDDVETAYNLYWETSLREKERSEKLDAALLESAERICALYADHQIDADLAAKELSMLGSFGDGAAELLEGTFAEFRGYNTSREHMEKGQTLYEAGKFLTAREEFLKVSAEDSDYASAMEKAEACLVDYGNDIAAQAEALMQENDYQGALRLLKNGNTVLFDFNTFSEAIDQKLPECYERYARYLLDEAKKLADSGEYTAAALLLQEGALELDEVPEAVSEAQAEYRRLGVEKLLADTRTKAEELFGAECFEEMFDALDKLETVPEAYTEKAETIVTGFEDRFAENVIAKAEEAFGGEREKLPDAIAVLDDALEIRALEAVQEKRDDLARYLPLNLVEAEYSEKSGTVFRSAGTFEGLDGTEYTEGWLWGEDSSEITFVLDGAYDEFTCSFAVRRKDNVSASGRFEIWCDGKQYLRTDKLHHYQEQPQEITLDISGCNELKIVFLCDYTVSTAENGYCYHGLCNASLTKDLPEIAETEAEAEQ